jgi:hypothetical protein
LSRALAPAERNASTEDFFSSLLSPGFSSPGGLMVSGSLDSFEERFGPLNRPKMMKGEKHE